MVPAAGMGPTAAPPAAAPATVPAPAPGPTASTVASSPPPTPPTAGGTGFLPPYAVAPPGIGFGSGISARGSASATKTASEPDGLAAATAAAAREQARARRRAGLHRAGEGFMDMNVDVETGWDAPPIEEPAASMVASGRGAGHLGFAGAERKETVAGAAGLTTVAGDEFGGGPRMPMVPGTWDVAGARDRGDGVHDSVAPGEMPQSLA